MERSDLAPAKPKRDRVAKPAPTSSSGVAASAPVVDVGLLIDARLDALSRTIDARLDALSRTIDAGLQEMASRTVVIAEASDEKLDDVNRRVGELALALVKMQASIDALDPSDVRSDLRLVADRLSTLVGGPTMTELMDRIDEVAARQGPEEPKKRRRTKPVTAGD